MANNLKLRGRTHKRQRGAALVEMAIVVTVFLVLVFGIIEFARAIFEWSRLVEATRAGVRYAIVNDPACNIFNEDIPEDPYPAYLDQVCETADPTANKYLECGDGEGTQEVFFTVDGDCTDDSAGCRIVSEHIFKSGELAEIRGNMRGIQPLINTAGSKVTISYACTDAGYAGNAINTPAVTLRVEDVDYVFIAAGLLGLYDPDDWPIKMPAFETTRISEDMNFIITTGPYEEE